MLPSGSALQSVLATFPLFVPIWLHFSSLHIFYSEYKDDWIRFDSVREIKNPGIHLHYRQKQQQSTMSSKQINKQK